MEHTTTCSHTAHALHWYMAHGCCLRIAVPWCIPVLATSEQRCQVCRTNTAGCQSQYEWLFRPAHLTLNTKLRMENGAIRSPMPSDAASTLPKRLICCLPAADVSCKRAAAASEVEAQLPAASSLSCCTFADCFKWLPKTACCQHIWEFDHLDKFCRA